MASDNRYMVTGFRVEKYIVNLERNRVGVTLEHKVLQRGESKGVGHEVRLKRCKHRSESDRNTDRIREGKK